MSREKRKLADNVQIKKRETNLELLRIVAMLMVISLHYLDKGNALAEIGKILPGDGNFTNEILAWCFEVLSYGAVNLYIMISGYFMINSRARMEKPFKMVVQVLFYSIGIFLIFLVMGKLPDYATETFYKHMFFTPVAASHYWFASSYIFFYLTAPFLAVGIRKLNKTQHLGIVIITMLLFSRLWKTILPQTAPLDDKGYGILWFITLFVLASYIRRFVPVKKSRRLLYFGIYLLASALTLASFFVVNLIFVKTGRFEVFIKVLLEYNSPTIIVASTALFLFFRTISVPEGFLSKAVLFISPLTFGIYLLHEQFLLRSLWTDLWKVEEAFVKPWFVLHYIGVVLAVFIIGAIVEWIRKTLFDLLYKTGPLRWFFKKLGKLDAIFPEKDENFPVAEENPHE